MDILSAEVKGIGIMPELSRHFTKKEGGHLVHLRLRRRADKKILVYLSTDLYVPKAQFDPRTKNLFSKEGNDRLVLLFQRAIAMLRRCKVDTDYKVAWQRDGEALVREQEEAERKVLEDQFTSGSASDHYAWLVNKSVRMARELAKIEQEAEELRIKLNLPPRKEHVTYVQQVEYQDTLSKFMTLRRNTLGDRDFQMWASWHKVLNEFTKALGVDMSIATIGMDFYRRYKTYLMVTRGNTANTFGAHVKKLKSFLKYAEGEGKTLNREAKSMSFKIVEEPKKVVYLSDEELNLLWDYRLVRPTAIKIISLCLFQSLTGLRISDAAKHHVIVKRRDEESGEQREYLTGTCKKNKGTYLIPLSLDPRIKEILIDNSFNMKLLSEQVYNRDIKKILADMYAHYGKPNEETQWSRQDVKGGAVIATSLKSDLIATHSNRRSFISRHINSREFNHTDILKMLGSSDLKELQRYIDVDDVALNDKAKANARSRQTKAAQKKTKLD